MTTDGNFCPFQTAVGYSNVVRVVGKGGSAKSVVVVDDNAYLVDSVVYTIPVTSKHPRFVIVAVDDILLMLSKLQ